MTPMDENGGVWQFDSAKRSWTLLMPKDTTLPIPQPRSYHCMTSDGDSSLFVHAGCPEKGRLADLWSFDVEKREWSELQAAPNPPRGGASIAFASSKLWRMNGFDGSTEQGGSIDVYDFDDNSWYTKNFESDGQQGPAARSVSTLIALRIRGEDVLVTLFGEHDPSALGHAGAGKMLDDVWMFNIGAGVWNRIGSLQSPTARGWFDADVLDSSQIVVSGGLDPTNKRLQDIWLGTWEFDVAQ